MNLKEVAAISGKSGLFKIVKPSRTGVILESMDDKKIRMVASLNYKVSILSEISVYTTTKDGSVALGEIFKTIKEKYGKKLEIDTANNNAMMSFLENVLPEYDKSRVYASDVKKMINWYKTISTNAPDVYESVMPE
jgi:glutamate-1-semialdehyde aminotransferase